MIKLLKLKQRAIVKEGGAYYVSLPRDWLTNHNLYPYGTKKYLELFIDDHQALVILPAEVKNDSTQQT